MENYNLTHDRGLKQRVGEPYEHICEVCVDKCGFAAQDRDRHFVYNIRYFKIII